MSVDLSRYQEVKPSRIKRLCWGILNATLFRCLPSSLRNILLRAFDAKIGKSLIYRSVKIFAPWNLVIGDYSCIGPRVELYCKDKITIGDSSVISQDAYICTASHDIMSPVMATLNKPISIGSNVWIAAKAAVMPGASIADGTVVAACAVVAKSTEPWTVVGGNPAKFIKKRELKDLYANSATNSRIYGIILEENERDDTVISPKELYTRSVCSSGNVVARENFKEKL